MEHANLIVSIILVYCGLFYAFEIMGNWLRFFFFNQIATPNSSPGCEYAFGIYPDSPECSTTYLKCAYGEPAQHHCDDGLAYDERIHGCNWPDQLLHICNPEGKSQIIQLLSRWNYLEHPI